MALGPAAGIGAGLSLPMIDGATSGAAAAGSTGSTGGVSGAESVGGFADVLRGKLGELNSFQAAGDRASEDMATGNVDDVAQTMMQVEQANVSLQLATQLRNKAVEAYQEILRMQM